MIDRMQSRKSLSLQQLVATSLVAVMASATPQTSTAQLRQGGLDNLPALGEASVDELSPAAEQRLGDQIYQEFLRMGVIHDDPEATDVIAARSRQLLLAAQQLGHTEIDRPFRFFLVKDPSINAFALPGGYIGIHTGLLTASELESEVMSVLAHEIGHVTQRHIARMFGQQRQSSAVMLATALLAIMAARASADAAMGVISLGQTVAARDQMAFSRDAEREADRVGLQILAVSGYDPHGMSKMFERLSQTGRLYDTNAPSYLRSHPLTTERIADVQGRLQSEFGKPSSGGTNSLAFDWVRAKLTALADPKLDGLRQSRQRLLDQLGRVNAVSSASVAQETALRFGLAWVALAQRQFSEVDARLAEITLQVRQAGLDDQAAPFLDHLRLRLAMDRQAPTQELQPLVIKVTTTHPESRAIHRTAVEALVQAGLVDGSTSAIARRVTSLWPADPQAWALLARVEAARGKRALQHAASAEQYALVGAYAAAIDQLTLARRSADADFVTLSKIDARITALRAELRREQLERKDAERRREPDR